MKWCNIYKAVSVGRTNAIIVCVSLLSPTFDICFCVLYPARKRLAIKKKLKEAVQAHIAVILKLCKPFCRPQQPNSFLKQFARNVLWYKKWNPEGGTLKVDPWRWNLEDGTLKMEPWSWNLEGGTLKMEGRAGGSSVDSSHTHFGTLLCYISLLTG